MQRAKQAEGAGVGQSQELMHVAVQNVAKALWVTPEQRSAAQSKTLTDFVKFSLVFRELSEDVLHKVCSGAMQRETAGPGEVIFTQCESAHSFYVVLSGLVRLKQTAEGGVKAWERMIVPGDVFGKSHALRWESAYECTATAMENSQLIWICRDDYEAIIARFKEERVNEYTNFLQQQVDFTCDWPAARVRQVAGRLQNQIYEDREAVVRAGSKIEGIHFVWTGALRLMRTFDKVDQEEASTHQREIAQLLPGEYIGAEPCLQQDQLLRRQHEVLAQGPTELLFVRTADMLHHFTGIKSATKKLKNANSYPDDVTLREQLVEQMEWEEYKGHLLKPSLKPLKGGPAGSRNR
eukprot:TRINITY_DN12098_c0_g1_i7.p1 TRINITY_DN12098_c0_g1~~TRINITY_DN12098_c0_g1_i7.p1  ORF type:complete len:351 (-),score=110.39 TRINITY_DN12098_c0_g1_i7:297-1349(-)